MSGSVTEWSLEPAPAGLGARLRETWRSRWLIRFFAKQAILKSIRRTWLGWLWLPLRGLVPTLVGSLVLGGVLGVQSPGVPYPLFLLAGLIPWVLFALTASWCVRCLELSRRYLRAAAFPRLVLPLGYTAPALVDALMFGLAYLMLLAWFGAQGVRPVLPGIGVAFGALVAVATGMGWGMLLCIPGARARDVRFTLGFVLAGIFAVTPVAYPSQMVPPSWAWLVALNPLAAVVDIFRSALLGLPGPAPHAWILAASFALASLAAGLWVFTFFEDRLSGSI